MAQAPQVIVRIGAIPREELEEGLVHLDRPNASMSRLTTTSSPGHFIFFVGRCISAGTIALALCQSGLLELRGIPEVWLLVFAYPSLVRLAPTRVAVADVVKLVGVVSIQRIVGHFKPMAEEPFKLLLRQSPSRCLHVSG